MAPEGRRKEPGRQGLPRCAQDSTRGFVLDEPTDRPEGEVVELVPTVDWDLEDLEEDERKGLIAHLEEACREADEEPDVDFDVVLEELRALRESR